MVTFIPLYSIPMDISTVTSLQYLVRKKDSITRMGTLPMDISTVTGLQYLVRKKDSISITRMGTLPMDISTVTNLQYLVRKKDSITYWWLQYSSKLEDLEALTMDI